MRLSKKPRTKDIVLKIIEENWPVNVTNVVEMLEESNWDRTSAIAKIKYHFDRLAEEEKIRKKRIGRNVIAWPMEIEKLRMVQELIK